MAWSSLDVAMRLRSVMRSVSVATLQSEHPDPKFGVVTQLPAAGRCLVIYQDDTDPVPVRYYGVVPTAVGQRVMIDGPRRMRYISQVWNAPVIVPPDDGMP